MFCSRIVEPFNNQLSICDVIVIIKKVSLCGGGVNLTALFHRLRLICRKTFWVDLAPSAIISLVYFVCSEICVRDESTLCKSKNKSKSIKALSFLRWRHKKNRKQLIGFTMTKITGWYKVPQYENERKRTRNIMLETTVKKSNSEVLFYVKSS